MASPRHYRGSNRPDADRRLAIVRQFLAAPPGTKIQAIALEAGASPAFVCEHLRRSLAVTPALITPTERDLIARHRAGLCP